MAEKEYIEREAVSEYFREKFEYYKAESEIKVIGGYMYDEKMQYAAIVAKHFLDELKRTPAADVVEVKHGEWLSNAQTDEFVCSECDGIAPVDCEKEKFYKSDYCPNCGAKMDLEERLNEF